MGQASIKRVAYQFMMRESGAKKMNLYVGDLDMYDVSYCWQPNLFKEGGVGGGGGESESRQEESP